MEIYIEKMNGTVIKIIRLSHDEYAVFVDNAEVCRHQILAFCMGYMRAMKDRAGL